MSKAGNYTPFLRWAGGKRWLAYRICPFIKQRLIETKGTYFEPFLGAGAMFFYLSPQKSYLSDLNKELIDTYLTIRDSWKEVEDVMKKWKVTRENYYKIRSYKPRNRVNKAGRFVWLNRTCYGGLYRVNRQNEFNVPYGGGSRTPQVLYDNRILENAANALCYSVKFKREVEILVSDFEVMINKSKAGDVIYCDPTYSNVKRGQFDRYGKIIFSWQDQIRLAKASNKAYDRGVTVIISNGFFSDLNELYPKAYKVAVSRSKRIGNITEDPKRHKEYLFIIDPKREKNLWKEFEDSLHSYVR